MNTDRLFDRYRELQSYVDWTGEDARRVEAVAPLLGPHLPALVDDFYARIERHPEALKVITGGQAQIDHLKGTLLRWVGELLAGRYDESYVERRWRVGRRHVEIGLDQVYTNVALSRLRTGLGHALQRSWEGDLSLLIETARSLNKLLDLDLAIIEEAYQAEYAFCLQRAERLALEELKRAESQLVQAEKLSALGRVVAGVAHEINNPLAFVTNNVAVAGRDFDEIRELIRLYQQADPELAEHRPDLLATIRDRAERIDLDYTLENLGPLMARSADGLKRIHQIVKDLRNFARLDESDLQVVDLNDGVASTLNILRGEAEERQVALVEERGRLPAVTCYPAKINQVILNLVANAIEACAPGGRVTVATRPAGDGVEVVVGDDGRGIEPSIRDQIFEPFFTTKPVGQGTGLGLSISHAIVRDHGGRIEVESAAGRGSRFTVRLPCEIGATEPPPRR